MRSLRAPFLLPRVILLAVAAMLSCAAGEFAQGSELRRSAIVKAVEGAKYSVLNIHGQKILSAAESSAQGSRAVNGMGTGVVIDQRGYLLTNFHVVDGVRRIQVTNADGKTAIAKLIAHDRPTDLAVIKIPQDDSLHPVPLGTSDDLMVGETVIAMGNAYGYNHSVTRGIISALHRDVPISETQHYYDLIQTDAGINPGNSGGPLLNIDGDMIGLNVAVRVGAQGIGFAIPVDQALQVSAELIRQHSQQAGYWHGVTGKQRFAGGKPLFQVSAVAADSPAAKAGIAPGDVISSISGREIRNELDFELALLDRRAGEELAVNTSRNSGSQVVSMLLDNAPADNGSRDIANQTWRVAGLRLLPLSNRQFKSTSGRYRGGLQVTAVRPGSPAEREHIQPGDILVGMHVWETVTLENVGYVLRQKEVDGSRPVKCFILRDDRTHYAYLPISETTRR